MQDAVMICRDISDPEKAAKRLADEALARGSNDNISCIVLRFRF
jgi:protein phosphatase 1L